MRHFPSPVGVIAVIPLLVASGVAAFADDLEVKQPKPGPDTRQFVKGTLSPGATVKAAAGAAVNQANDTPHEWGQGAAGFGRRFASAFGKHIVSHSIHYTVARIRHEEFGYHPSGKHGFGPRLKYALASVVITHKTTTGKPTIAAGQLSGAFGSGMTSRLWQPASTGTMAAGFASAGTSLGVDAGIRVVREFWPDIRHPHRHRAA